jgi:hypothetical protein
LLGSPATGNCYWEDNDNDNAISCSLSWHYRSQFIDDRPNRLRAGQNDQNRRAFSHVGAGLLFRGARQARRRARAGAAQQGGVNGYKFVVQYEDSACSPLPATQAAKRLIEQFKPDVIIGEECSDATLAVMPVVEQAKVPLINAGSSSIKVTEPGNPWTFRIMPNEVMQGINLAEKCVQTDECADGSLAV